METAEHGESVLALSVDVNDNEEGSKVTGAPSRLLIDNRNPVCTVDRTSGHSGKGRTYIANSGKNVNVDSTGVSECVRIDNDIMLDLVAECLPRQINDSCVISGLYNDGKHSGCIESSVHVTVGSDAGGGGSGVTPSCSATAANTARQGEGGDMLLQMVGVSEKIEEDLVMEIQDNHSDQKGFDPGSKSAALSSLSCTCKLQLNCACTASSVSKMNRTNGDVYAHAGQSDDPGTDFTSRSRTSSSDTLFRRERNFRDKEVNVKLANGDLMVVVNRSSLRKFETQNPEFVKDVHCDFYGHSSNEQVKNLRSSQAFGRNCSGEWCHVNAVDASVIEAASADAARCNNINRTETEPSTSDGSFSARPLTLRTNPKTPISLSCDATPLSPEDEGGFGADGCTGVGPISSNVLELSRHQSAPDKCSAVAPEFTSDNKLISTKLGFSEFFSRKIFSWKPKETKLPSPNGSGWKVFGRIPLWDSAGTESQVIQQDSNPGIISSVSTPNLLNTGELEPRGGKAAERQPSMSRRKKLEFEPLSTTALILEDRPPNLPAKPEEEALRHRQEYDEMVAGAKKRELKEAQRKKRQMKERYRQEEIIANTMVIWNNEILTNWESVRNTRRVRELWWQGLPPSVRGRVWSLAIGNELNITHELYEIFLSRAKERWKSFGSENETEDCGASQADREASLELIKLDISRTFPSLFIFQKGGPYHDLLHSVLGAYTCYRPDVGYVQGMSFIAAVLILNLEEADAFIAFANLLNKPCQMGFFRVDHDLMLKYFAVFEVFFEENLPRLFNHFLSNNLTPDLYLIDWIFTLYSKSLPLDVACRVWDVFCRDGEEFLFRTALGILRLYEDVLLQMDFIHVAQFLTRLPDDMAADPLFSCIAATHMLSGNRKWNQVFSALLKEGSREIEKNNSPALRS